MCRRLGELLRQEEERLHKMKLEGHALYIEYVQQGHDAKLLKQVSSNDSGRSNQYTISWFWPNSNYVTSRLLTRNVNIVVRTLVWHYWY